MRSGLIFLALMFSAALLGSCNGSHRNYNGSGSHRVVHLSLDDVELFDDLITHQQEYDSLFQHPLLAFLKDLHGEYGVRITLYTYDHLGHNDSGTRLEDMPLKYKNDFLKASDWLRIGFHNPRARFDSLVSVAEFSNAYNNVNTAIARFADSSMIAKTLRLHYFFAPDSLVNSLPGTTTLLCADHNNVGSYNLTPAQVATVANGKEIVKNNIAYRRTDLRIDDNFRILSKLKQLEPHDTLVIFAHEWKLWHNPENMSGRSTAGRIKVRAFDYANRILFKETVKWLNDAGYSYSFLE